MWDGEWPDLAARLCCWCGKRRGRRDTRWKGAWRAPWHLMVDRGLGHVAGAQRQPKPAEA